MGIVYLLIHIISDHGMLNDINLCKLMLTIANWHLFWKIDVVQHIAIVNTIINWCHSAYWQQQYAEQHKFRKTNVMSICSMTSILINC